MQVRILPLCKHDLGIWLLITIIIMTNSPYEKDLKENDLFLELQKTVKTHVKNSSKSQNSVKNSVKKSFKKSVKISFHDLIKDAIIKLQFVKVVKHMSVK